MIGYILGAMALDLAIQLERKLEAKVEKKKADARHAAERRRVTAALSRGDNPRRQQPLCSCNLCTRYYT